MSIYEISAAERRRQAQEKVKTTTQGMQPQKVAEDESGFWATLGDFFGNILKGALKGIEGIYDFGASVVGEVGGWFDEGFKEDVREHIEYDWAGDTMTPWLKDLEKQSYLGEDSFLRNVAQGVGGMLPAVVTGGATHIGAVGTGTMMLGAAGQGTEEALKSGADYESAVLYGAGSGAVEGLTEKIGGFTFGGPSKLGKAVAGTRLSKGLGKVAFDAVSEGAEEVLADYIDPALKYATGVDKNIGENYLEAAKNTGKTFLTGAAVGSVMQGVNNIVRNVSNKSRGGSHATKADNAVANIIEATGNYNGAANNDFKYDKVVKYNLETVSSELVKMSPEARKNYLDSIGIYKNAFDRETGKLKENSMPYAHNEAITANLRTFSGNLTHKPLKGTESITNGAKVAKKTVERVIGSGAAVVVTNELGADDRAIYNPDDGVIYINNNADLTEKDVANMVALHEIAHATEGTKAYARLIETLENMTDDPNAPQAIKDIVGNVEARRSGIKKDYAEQLGKMSDQYQKGYLVQSELHADLVGELLGNDYFIEKLAERDMGLLEKLYHSFKNRANAKKSELGPDGIKYLKKLASKFGTAIEKRAGGVKLSQIGDEDEKEEKKYSYETLTKKKDLVVVSFTDNVPKKDSGQINSKAVLAEGRKNARAQANIRNTDTETYVRVDDIKIDVLIGAKGMQHGLARSEETAMAVMKIGDILKNSVAINELNGSTERQTEMSYVLLGACKDSENVYAVRTTVSKLNNNVTDIDIFQLGAVKGKKIETPNSALKRGAAVTELSSLISSESPIISIADFLEYVKDISLINEAFSQDVADNLGVTRSKGALTNDLRYSRKRSYDPKNGKEPTFEEIEGGVKINFNDFDATKSNDNSNDFEAAENARREGLDALLKDRGTTFVGLTNADLDEYVATGKTLHTRNKKQRMLENGKSPILTTENEITEFVTKAIHGEALGEARAFGKVDERLAQAISNVRTSLNLEGKYLEIQADAIREAYKVHSTPKEKGDIALTEEDFKNIHRHIFDFDGVLSVDTHNGKTEIHMYKKSEGGYYHILTVVSSERNALQITKLIGVSKEKFESKYAKKIERSTGSLRMQEASDPSTKAQHTAGVLSNNSIHKNGEKSNSSDKKTQKNHYNSKKTVRELIEGAIDTLDLTDEEGKALAFVTKDAEGDVVTAFWKAINSASGGTRRKLMDNLADVLLANTVFAEKSKYEALDYLKSVMHKFDLREIQEQIEPSLKRKINARWGFKAVGSEDSALDMRSVITALNKMGLNISYADPVQALIEINNFYDSVREYAELEKGDRLSKRLGEEDYKAKKKELVSELTRIFEENKTENELASKLTFVIEKSQEENKKHREYKKEFKQDEKRTRAIGVTVYLLNKFKNIKNHKYDSATQPHFDEFMGVVKTISKMEYRGNINQSSVRELMTQVKEWYGKDNPLLNYVNEEHKGLYCEQIAEAIDYFVKGEHAEQEFSYSELRAFNDILSHLSNLIENHNKIWKDGRYVDLADVAGEQKARLDDAIKYKTNALINLAGEKLGKNMLDPQSVFAGLDAYDENGFFSTTFREIRYGLIECKANQVKALEELDNFREKNKKYFKKLLDSKNTVKVSFTIIRDEDGLPQARDIEIPVYAAIDLYMTSRTGKDALETLEETGFFLQLDNSKGSERMGTVTREQLDALYEGFSQQDKELIEILRKQYNGFLQQLKIETDFKRFGFSNVIDGEYYPLRRYVAESSEEPDNFFNEVDRVLNSPFNNSRVKGTKNALLIGNALTKFMRHVEGVTKYASLAIPIENANRIKNADVGGNLRMPTSILTTLKSKENPQYSWANGYLDSFISDIQGISIKMDDGQKLIGKLRGAFATYQLGFNPKVWLTQISSYLAAFGELRLSSLAKAITIKGAIKDSEVDKYCELAKIRHYEKGVTKASTVSEKIGKFGNITTTVIEKVDRGVIKMLFAACQAEAKARYKLEIGTEANKIKAGEILTDVILNSQQNQLFSEYSAMMRSKSDIVKSFTMFGADSMKLLSRFFENLGRVITLNRKMKVYEKGSDAYNSLKVQRNRAALKLAKYSAAIAAVSAFMAAIAKLFKHIYNKDDEEETVGEWLGVGTVDNILGMAPVFRDLYSLFREGYEVDTFATSMINDVGASFKTLIDNTVSSIRGKEVGSTEWLATAKKLVFALGQLTGVPTRNVYNFTVGMTRRLDEGTGKSIDAWFKEPSESDAKASLREGIEDRDESLTEYGLNSLYKKYELEFSDSALKAEMDRLVKLDVSKDEGDENNYSPLGFKIPENLEIDGEDVELSAEDRKVFKNGLNSAEKSSANMVKTYYYRQLNDKYKAYAIRKVFEYYDLMSREELGAVSEERARLLYYGEAVGIDVLAVLMAYKQELNGASDAEKAKRKQSTKELVVEYLKKFNLTPVQKSLVLRALGYSDKDNDKLVKAFIEKRPGLSKEQKAEFLAITKIE